LDSAALTASNLHLWRGERHVLRGVSFRLHPGEALHLWGPNGAGKTSLLRVVCGLLQPEEGEVRWQGREIREANSEYLSSLAYLGHDSALKGDLTAAENIHFGVGLKAALDQQRLSATLADLGVAECAQLPCRVLSAGQRRRVALCRVLLADARLWVLDEPYTHLDAASSERISASLTRHLAQGGMALIAAHQSLGLRTGAVTRLELS
jgi:heme exporter protein A